MTSAAKPFLNISTYEALLFCSLYDTGNTTETARVLSTTTAHVSVGLSRLERKIGTDSLFIRNRRQGRYVPTNAGMRIEPQMRCIVQFSQEILNYRHQGENSITLTSSHSLLEYFLGPFIVSFLDENPHLRLHFKQDDAMSAELLSLNEIALTCFLQDDPAYSYFAFHTFRQKLWASPTYIDRHGNPSSLEELKHHRLLMRKSKVDPTVAFGSSAVKVQLTEDVKWCEVSGSRLIDYLCAQGCGIMPGAEEMVRISELNLENVFPDFKGDDMTLYVCARKDFLKKEIAKQVLNWIFKTRNEAFRRIGIAPIFPFTPLTI